MALVDQPFSPDAQGAPVLPPTWRTQFEEFMKRAVLGAAAGSIAGAFVGGIGGRLAMLLLRVTSPGELDGTLTDDEFEIGRFTLSGSLNLLVASAFFGSVIGLFIVLSRAFLPGRWVTWAWGLAGGTVLGALIISDDGVDFTVIEPLWLAVVLFVALPAAGTLLMAFLVDSFEPWWWHRRRRTAVASLAALPVFVFFPVAVLVMAIGAAWALASRNEAVRSLPDRPLAQRAAAVVFGLVVVISAWQLALDVRDVL